MDKLTSQERAFYTWVARLRCKANIRYSFQEIGIQHLLHGVENALWHPRRLINDEIAAQITMKSAT